MKDWLWYTLGGVALLGAGVLVYLLEFKKKGPSLAQLTQTGNVGAAITGLTTAQQATNTAETAASGALRSVPVAGGALSALTGFFLSGHIAREKGATDENEALNALIPAMDTDLANTFAAANDGEITPAEAIQAVTIIWNNYWTGIAPLQTAAGAAGAGIRTPLSTLETGNANGVNGGSFGIMCNSQAPPGGVPCNKSCTDGCCVGNDVVTPTIQQAIKAFQSPTGGTITACKVYGTAKYGSNTRNAYQLTFRPPSSIPLSVAHLL